MNDTLTAAEISEILGRHKSSVIRAADKDGWVYANGGNRMKHYYIDQLPAEVQERIYRYWSGIDSETVEEMASRCEIVVPPAKLKDPAVASKIRMLCECLAVPENARGRDMRIREIAEASGYSRGTAYRLMRLARAGKPILAETRQHGHTFRKLGITVRAWAPEAARIAIEAVMGNRRRQEEGLSIYNRVTAECEGLGLRYGSLRSFYDLAGKIDPALLKYRDAGARGLREDIVPAIRRDHTAYRAMECLVGDQHKADYYCLDRNGEIATLELFCWMDFRTQMVWPAIAYKHYNRYTVGQALINAVRWGLPSIVYTDWGKPEESHYISLLIEQLSGLGVRCDGIRHTNAKVRHPQAKPIEAWLGRLDRDLRNARIPGYMKRLRDSRENELQQRELKELAKSGGLLSIEELPGRIFAVIEKWNDHLFKNRGIDNGKSPRRIYTEEAATYRPTTLDPATLEYIFLPKAEATVRRSQVRVKNDWLGNITYYHPELSTISGEGVEVRRMPFDTSYVWVFHKSLEGGVLRADEWAMINPKNRDHVAERIEQQNSLVKQVRETFRAYAPPVETVAGINRATRAAKQMKKSEEIRVMRTSLEEEGEIRAAEGGGRGYRALAFEKKERPMRLRPVFAVRMDRQADE